MKLPIVSVTLVLLIKLSVVSALAMQDHRPVARPACGQDSGIAATFGSGSSISIDEVDKSIGKQLHALEEKIYLLRRQALESLISRVVLEAEANRSGVSVDQLIDRLLSVDAKVSEQRINEVLLENEQALAPLGQDQARAKVRLDLENQLKLAALRTRTADLRSRANVNICLEAPVPPRLAISDSGASVGPRDAPVTIWEYSDFQCPYCRQARSTVAKILAANEGKVRLVFKHLPLPIHPRAFPAAVAAFCAQDQGQFWPFHDRLFDSTDLSDDSLMGIARDVRLDPGRFAECISSERARTSILADMQEANKAGFSGTPTFVINGSVVRGLVSLTEFQRAIDLEINKRKGEQKK